jgi:hypothetical protein
MSLVNDALRRAQDAQKKTQAPPPGPQFRPAEPAAPPKRGMGMMVPVIIALVVVGVVMLILLSRQKTEARQPVVETKPETPVVALPESKPPIQYAAAAAPAPATSPAVVVVEKPASAPVASAPAPVIKLQAIFFSPGHSSAMISGKTVHVGDNFKGFRIAAITQTSATLVNVTQTNVLTLEQD